MTVRRAMALALLVAGLTSACASDDTAPIEGMADCQELVRQATYEAMRQLAINGQASDPETLVDNMVEPGTSEGTSVDVPTYEVFSEEYSDAEQAELYSALSSSSIGVGAALDVDAFYRSIAVYGACSDVTF